CNSPKRVADYTWVLWCEILQLDALPANPTAAAMLKAACHHHHHHHRLSVRFSLTTHRGWTGPMNVLPPLLGITPRDPHLRGTTIRVETGPEGFCAFMVIYYIYYTFSPP